MLLLRAEKYAMAELLHESKARTACKKVRELEVHTYGVVFRRMSV